MRRFKKTAHFYGVNNMKENKELEKDDIRINQEVHGQIPQEYCNNFYGDAPTIGGLTWHSIYIGDECAADCQEAADREDDEHDDPDELLVLFYPGADLREDALALAHEVVDRWE